MYSSHYRGMTFWLLYNNILLSLEKNFGGSTTVKPCSQSFHCQSRIFLRCFNDIASLLERESFSRCFNSLKFHSRTHRSRRGHCDYTHGQASGSCSNKLMLPFPIPGYSLGALLMALSSSGFSSFGVSSYIRGYHVYQDVWSPIIGEVFTSQKNPQAIRKTFME